MAKLHHFVLFFYLAGITSLLADDQSVVLLQSQRPVRRPLREKLSHLRFYFHDTITGPRPTAVQVVPPASNTTGFGAAVVIDDPLTLGPTLSSKLVGRAQGFYCFTSVAAPAEEPALLLVMNLVFLEGKYNGSTVAIMGRNAVFSGVREMPVVGGSGLFRLARGYAQARTYSFDVKTGNAVVEYNVFVMHY